MHFTTNSKRVRIIRNVIVRYYSFSSAADEHFVPENDYNPLRF